MILSPFALLRRQQYTVYLKFVCFYLFSGLFPEVYDLGLGASVGASQHVRGNDASLKSGL